MICKKLDQIHLVTRGRVALFGLWLVMVGIGTADEVRADVVKPALIEINAYATGEVRVEIRASIEALLTGINARYKNTKQAPNAAQYDALRVLQGPQLRAKFVPFEQEFLRQIFLKADGRRINLAIKSLTIPDAGYTKVPRDSVIVIGGPLERATKTLQFYYPARFGDSAIRVRQIDKQAGKYHWSEWQWIKKMRPVRNFH